MFEKNFGVSIFDGRTLFFGVRNINIGGTKWNFGGSKWTKLKFWKKSPKKLWC